MSAPTSKTILAAFPKLSPEQAKDLGRLFRQAEHPLDVRAGEAKVSWDDALEFANEALGGHGVEAIQPEGAYVDRYFREAVLLYVNMGDPYDTTVLFDTHEREFLVGSWGDWLEAWEQAREQEAEEEAEGR